MFDSRDMTNVPVIVAANKMDLIGSKFLHLRANSSSHVDQQHAISANRMHHSAEKDRKEIMQVVRKSWRSSHVECSAKYNWNVVSVFKELAVTLDMIANGQVIGGNQGSTKKKRCLFF